MPTDTHAFPAIFLVKAQGGILFANPQAIEATGQLTGTTPGSLGTLDNLLDRLFPKTLQRLDAGRTLHRALGLARRRGQIRLRIAVPRPGRSDRAWDVSIQPSRDHAEETYQMSFRPAETGEPDHLHRLRTATSYARRVLDNALDGLPTLAGTSAPAGAELDTFVAVMERARGLLATLEAHPGPTMNRFDTPWNSAG